MGVSANWGHRVQTLIPRLMRRGEIESAKLINPPFAAEYTGAGGMGNRPPADAVNMITPAHAGKPETAYPLVFWS